MEKPAGVTPSQGRTTVALRRSLQSEPSPALHLPPSELLKALIGDVNSTLDKFVEEQTPNAFIPLQMKRQRRYYRDRPLSPQRVREANPIQNGDGLISPSLGKRGRLPSIHRPERRLLPGARPSLLPEVAPFRLGRFGPPVPSPLLRTIDRPSGLHTGVRHSVGLGPLPGSPPPPVPGRLDSPGLFGGQDQTACPRPLVAVPLLRDTAQRQKVRTGPLTVSGALRHDHRHGGGPSVPHHDSNKQTPRHWEEVPRTPVSPRPAVAGVVGTHVIAGVVSSRRETQDALTPVAIEDTLVPQNRHTPPPPPLPVPRSRQVEEDLAWWMKTTRLLQGRPFGTPAPDLRLYSDAS